MSIGNNIELANPGDGYHLLTIAPSSEINLAVFAPNAGDNELVFAVNLGAFEDNPDWKIKIISTNTNQGAARTEATYTPDQFISEGKAVITIHRPLRQRYYIKLSNESADQNMSVLLTATVFATGLRHSTKTDAETTYLNHTPIYTS